ncbi:hypothetical protein F511_27982 [Dorcoceras hygrometricum]|uniref:Uncharacterized protein n=1 Tax=Dorcoceras hygrometricum TaxID=472368 RepID=A0A2Z7CTX6_9LAMI|nr:hypothetical protein F511_27982 [Dorcoceras hygrometricum]
MDSPSTSGSWPKPESEEKCRSLKMQENHRKQMSPTQIMYELFGDLDENVSCTKKRKTAPDFTKKLPRYNALSWLKERLNSGRYNAHRLNSWRYVARRNSSTARGTRLAEQIHDWRYEQIVATEHVVAIHSSQHEAPEARIAQHADAQSS